jgi:cellobiose phosphorylase
MKKTIEKCRLNLKNGQEPLAGFNKAGKEEILTRYSHFIDEVDKNGIVVSSKLEISSLHTPRPYLHLMASNHHNDTGQWGSFWDQRCGGFCCVDSVLAGRMSSHTDTNYVPTAPKPTDTRNFYIHENGSAYSMFPVPEQDEKLYTDFKCVMGLDNYSLNAVRNGIQANLSVTVHPDMPIEIWQITLQNISDKKRSFSWFSRIRVNIDSFPFYYFEPRVVCNGEFEDGIMVFRNADGNNKHPRAAFLAADSPFDGFDMMEEVFDKSCGRASVPTAVKQGNCFNSLGVQPYAGLIAASQFNTELAPGELHKWTLVYGSAPHNIEKRKIFLGKVKEKVLANPSEIELMIDTSWKSKVMANTITTPDKDLSRYFNIWSKYQARNQARFTRALDKIGYRDILQDIMGVIDFEPEYVRAKLTEVLRYQFADGTAVRQYEKFKDTGHDMRMYQDSPVWIIDTLTGYLKQTGDFTFLEKHIPWLDRETLQPSISKTGTIYEHAKRAVESLFSKTGYYGLCASGYGDWNDAISGIGGENGVSTWLSCACVYAAQLMQELAEYLSLNDDISLFKNIADTMTTRINKNAWDGKWYIYAFSDKGTPIGASACEEGKIHLNVNTWAIFTGIAAAAGREDIIWKSIEKLATPIGHRLLMPAYTAKSRNEVGRIADQVPGMFENGSIYTHGEAFFLYALIYKKCPDDWYKNILKTLPSKQVPDIATGPPHQQSNFFTGPDHPDFGANLYSNFTGSVAWYRKGIEKLAGVIPEYGGIRIEPLPPEEWKIYSVQRTFRGSIIKFTFERSNDIPTITINGNTVVDNFIPATSLQAGSIYEIKIR